MIGRCGYAVPADWPVSDNTEQVAELTLMVENAVLGDLQACLASTDAAVSAGGDRLAMVRLSGRSLTSVIKLNHVTYRDNNSRNELPLEYYLPVSLT